MTDNSENKNETGAEPVSMRAINRMVHENYPELDELLQSILITKFALDEHHLWKARCLWESWHDGGNTNTEGIIELMNAHADTHDMIALDDKTMPEHLKQHGVTPDYDATLAIRRKLMNAQWKHDECISMVKLIAIAHNENVFTVICNSGCMRTMSINDCMRLLMINDPYSDESIAFIRKHGFLDAVKPETERHVRGIIGSNAFKQAQDYYAEWIIKNDMDMETVKAHGEDWIRAITSMMATMLITDNHDEINWFLSCAHNENNENMSRLIMKAQDLLEKHDWNPACNSMIEFIMSMINDMIDHDNNDSMNDKE